MGVLDMESPSFPAAQLQSIAEKVLVGYGAHPGVAEDTAHSIVTSSLRGIDSHGFNLLPKIVGRVTDKDCRLSQIEEPSELVVPGEGMPIGVIDAKLTPGQHACLHAARVAADKAERFGIGLVTIRDSTHFGSCAPFLLEVVKRKMIAMVGSNSTQSMAAFGAPNANLGNMPLGFAAPVEDGPDFLFDFCCAVMSFGKLNRLKAAGAEIPPDAFKKKENIAEDALFTNAAAMENLALPFRGVKGANIAMMVETLSGLLSFGNFGAGTEVKKEGRLCGPSHFVMAIDPAKFGEPGRCEINMKEYLAELKASHADIVYAGERASETQARREAEGVPVSAELKAEINELAAAVGVELDW